MTSSDRNHGRPRTTRDWLATIAFAASFTALSGCAGGPGQSLSAADRAAVRSAHVGDVKVTQPMNYQAKGAGIGAVFGIVGAVAESAARSSAPPDEATLLVRAIGPDHALLKDIVKTEFVTAASQRSGIQFVDGQASAPSARLDLTVNLYGFGRSHLLASQVQPLLNLTATLTGADGRALWRKSDFVTALSSANAQTYDVKQLIEQPDVLRAAIRQATTIVVRDIVADLPGGPGATTGAVAPTAAGTGTAAAVAPAPSGQPASDASRTPTSGPAPAAAAPTKAHEPTQMAAATSSTGATRANAALGSVLTFELTDTLTKITRTVSVPRNADLATRILLGDIGAMQPPAGWLPTPAQPGSTWNATFDAPFGADQARTSLAGVVEGQERIDTRAGAFDAWRVKVRGSTQRPFSSSGSTKSPHPVDLVVWVDPASGQVVRSQSRVTGTMGSAETTELVGPAR